MSKLDQLEVDCECGSMLDLVSTTTVADTLKCGKCKSIIAINDRFYRCNDNKCEMKQYCVSCAIIKVSGLNESQLTNMRRKYVSQLAAKPNKELTVELGRIYAENLAFRQILFGAAHKSEQKSDNDDDKIEYASENEFWEALQCKTKERSDESDLSIIASIQKYAPIYGVTTNVGLKEGANHFLWAYAVMYNRLKVIRYLLQSLQFSKETIDHSIKTGIDFGNYAAVRMLQSSKRDLETQTEALAMESKRSRFDGVSTTFIDGLKANTDDLEKVMCVLENALIHCIEGTSMNGRKVRYSFPDEVMNIVVKYRQLNESFLKSRLWKALNENISKALDITTVAKNKIDWLWFEDNLMHSTLWMSPIGDKQILFSQLLTIVDAECDKQTQALINDLSALIDSDAKSWQRLVEFDRHKMSKATQKRECRSDRIRYGLIAAESGSKLEMQSLIGESGAFAADKEYDFGVYLTSLIIRAHRLNPLFQNGVESYFQSMIAEKRVEFRIGPVKDATRCRIKAQLDYSQCDFPTSARIADFIRASVVFDDLQSYIDSIEEFSAYIDSGKDAHLTQIIAIKNGFNKLTAAPQRYRDVKFLITVTNDATKEAIIAELQFLLRPVLDYKRTGHKLYEIQRIKDVFLGAKEAMAIFSAVETQLKCAIDEPKPINAIAKIINNNPFAFKSKTIDTNVLSELMSLAAKRGEIKSIRFIKNTFGDKLNWEWTNYGFSILHSAVFSKNAAMVSYVCNLMPKPQFAQLLTEVKSGYSPLHIAVRPHYSNGLLLCKVLFGNCDGNTQLLNDAFNTIQNNNGMTVRDKLLKERLTIDRYAHERDEWNQLLKSAHLEPL